MDNRVQINRDPFARITLTRELVDKNYRNSCDWCGSREGKFIYWYESDGGRDEMISGEFCSKSCMECYYN